MKVLVTGATGFIGRAVIDRLLSGDMDLDIGAIAREVGRPGGCDGARVKLIRVDITKADDLERLSKTDRFDVIIHSAGLAHQFAAIDEHLFHKVNVDGTENLARFAAATGAKRFVLISSTSVYGQRSGKFYESSVCEPTSAYAKSKLESEKIAIELCEANGIALTIFRLAPVLGKKCIGNIPRLIDAIARRRFIWIGPGNNVKALIHVDDVADACAASLGHKQEGTEIYNLAAAPIKMERLVGLISEFVERPVPEIVIPPWLPQIFFRFNSVTMKLNSVDRLARTVEKWLSDDIYVADKFKRDYGFEPRRSINKAIEEQCQWYLGSRE